MTIKASNWINCAASVVDARQMTGVLGFLTGTVAAMRPHKASHYGSYRALDDAILRDIGVSRADLYGDEPHDRV